MATILDASLIGFLLPVFVFLFIFVILYGLLSKTELLGKKQVALNFLAAICIAAVAVFAGDLIKLVGVITPWIVFIIFILFLIFGMYKFFGIEDKVIWSTIGSEVTIYIILLLVILIGLTIVFEPQVSPFAGNQAATASNATGLAGKNVRSEVISTLTHPRVLGAIFILVIAAVTIKLLVDKTE